MSEGQLKQLESEENAIMLASLMVQNDVLRFIS